MEFKKEDENYVYNVIGKNIKKYRKMKKMTQAQLAEEIDYSLSFISSIESKKYQSFSLGALWRISLILGVDMYKLCIDEDAIKIKQEPSVIKYRCKSCDYETEIPYELIKLLEDAKKIGSDKQLKETSFNCSKCDDKIYPIE